MSGREELPDRARDGLEHLQAAAKELIAAGRSFLDAAEDLVEDPSVVADLVNALGTLAKMASGVGAQAAKVGADDADNSRVQRIRVS